MVLPIVLAVQTLEGAGQYGPFACLLGQGLYAIATAPAVGFILPSDRIMPFLGGGPLLRSSVLPPGRGAVVALGGSAIDLVVARDVHVKFLQVSVEPRYILRVSERFVLRVKQPVGIVRLV
jgi:hypothetical protein